MALSLLPRRRPSNLFYSLESRLNYVEVKITREPNSGVKGLNRGFLTKQIHLNIRPLLISYLEQD